VPLYLDKSIHLPLVILAVLKAGGCYLPLNTSDPISRTKFIVQQVKATILISSKKYSDRLQEVSDVCQIRILESLTDHIKDFTADVISMENNISTNDLAYIIYTSGSTGNPKGVMINHRAAVNSIIAHRKAYGHDEKSRVLQYANYCFDVSVTDIFVTLSSGGVLCMPTDWTSKSLSTIIIDFQITHLELTPTVATLLDPSDVPTVKTLILGGESVSQNVVNKWKSKCHLINSYGPTECTVSCFTKTVSSEFDGSVIGKVFGSNIAFILDDNLKLVAKGGVGELCMAGAQLARGYFQLEAEASKQFVSSPSINDGQRIYRTGDLVRLNTKNEVEILGRKDQQIKLHGFRIELTEIESTIWSHPRVNHVAVDVVKQNGNSFLAAWFVPDYAKDNVEDIALPLNDQNTEITKELILQLQNMTSTKLSKYMVPHHWIPVNYIPRSTSGKIDKKKLVQLAQSLNCKP
jgi:amino acid adenylation domain-containing protein